MAGAGMPETELFTRGGMDTGGRGESMVQKHAEKMQQEQEAKAMEKIGALMPQIGRLVHALALKECSWDVERAILLLRQFHADNADKLAALLKKHKKLLKAAAQQHQQQQQQQKEGEADEPPSSSEDGERSNSSSEEEEEGHDSERERSRKHKSSKSKSKSKKSRSTKESKESKEKRYKKRRREKEDRRKERSSPKAAKLTHGDSFGKYGILRETDYYSKRPEFMRWAMDEKRIDVDLMPKNEEREFFKEYMEDYNTGTLPHKKYYDLEAYDRYKAAKAARKGAVDAEAAAAKKKKGGMGFNDEQELMLQRQEARAKAQQDRLKEAFIELQTSTKAQDMRDQELLRMQAALAYKTGDMVTAQKLMERLKPDDTREEAGRKP